MSDDFLRLSVQDRADILQTAAGELGFTAQVLEKDAWVCWSLDKLFSLPNAHAMAFKGGTSLSKIWRAIDRFSEDIDITVDYRSFGVGFDHAQGRGSRSEQDRINAALRAGLADYLEGTVVPYLRDALGDQLSDEAFNISLEEDGETVLLAYPSAVTTTNPYIPTTIKLEFGARNTLDPSASHRVSSYLVDAKGVSGVHFPVAMDVTTLAVERTFWEKVILIHDACMRDASVARAERMSRHWYDLAMLMERGTVDLSALLADDSLFREIIDLKNVFYYRASSEYERCMTGQLQLVPDEMLREALSTDFQEMRDHQLVVSPLPDFEAILHLVRGVEVSINEHYS